jgi:hypothetical protein
LKITEIAQSFGMLFSTLKVVNYLLSTKNGLGYFVGHFLQTHLVTLEAEELPQRHNNKKTSFSSALRAAFLSKQTFIADFSFLFGT